MTAGPTIRLLEERDLAVLREAFGSSSRHVALRWRDRQAGRRNIFIAELDGETVGQVSFEEREEAPGYLYLFALGVLIPYRNRGIGTRLSLAVEEEAQRRALGAVDLSVNIENAGAIRLYERLGYEREEGIHEHRYVTDTPGGVEYEVVEDCYRMVKRLTPARSGPEAVVRPIFGP